MLEPTPHAYLYLNGHVLPWAAARLSPFDHGFTVGDGVFESLITYTGQAFAVAEHWQRLVNSARVLGIVAPSQEIFTDALQQVITANGLHHARLRVTLTAGEAALGSDQAVEPRPTFVVASMDLPVRPLLARVALLPWPRNERSALAQVKSTSYAENVVGLAAAKAQGAQEGLFCNTLGDLCEGTGSNLFLVRAGVLHTPPLTSGGLAGVTRHFVRQLCATLAIPLAEVPVPRAELFTASEAFLTSTYREVQAISQVDAHVLPAAPGPVTQRLQAAFMALTQGGRALCCLIAGYAALACCSELAQAETPAAKTAPPPSGTDVEGVTRVQIFLDENNFGPGKIDGEMGEFTLKAGQIFNQVHHLPKDNWYAILLSARKLVTSTYATYRLRENDFRFLVPSLPALPEEQAGYKYLGYHDIAEFLGEKFHTSQTCLTRLNPGVNFAKLKAGDLVLVPNVKSPFCIEQVPYSKKFPEDPVLSKHRVLVDTKERVATFYDEQNQLFASFPITPGQKKFIHVGDWIVGTMITTPEFRWDKAMLDEGKRSEQFYQLPPGPNNPVGIFWAGTNKTGIGLHGTSSPETIGRSESHGCVRLANWDAVRLPDLIRPGARLEMR